jgi:hypothetical protein
MQTRVNIFADLTWSQFRERLMNLLGDEPFALINQPSIPSPPPSKPPPPPPMPAVPTPPAASTKKSPLRRIPVRVRVRQQPVRRPPPLRARAATILPHPSPHRDQQSPGAGQPAAAAGGRGRRAVLAELLRQRPLPLGDAPRPLTTRAGRGTKAHVEADAGDLPTLVDWRAQGVVPPARDQGSCAYRCGAASNGVSMS